MTQPKLTRRQLFKASALGAGALMLAPAVAAPTREAQAAAEQPDGPAIPQPTFNPIASNTTFGPLTDISMGWDGTLWGIDAQGAPHVYDSINDAWAQHGDGIDAAALSVVSATQQTLYLFQGSSVVAVDALTLQASAPTAIGALWPNLPDSFKLGVSGAIAAPNRAGLILFNGGRYVSTDGSVVPGKLTDLANWPQSPTWKDGVIDGAHSGPGYLQRAGEVMPINMQTKSVDAPFPLEVLILTTPIPFDWAKSGVDAWAAQSIESDTSLVFKGTAVLSFNLNTKVTAPLSYLGNTFGNWPTTWHPTLAHAPNGRDGNLWSVLTSAKGSWIMQHDGEAWQQVPNQADHVGVDQDNAVMIASAGRLFKFNGKFDGTGFDPVSPANNLIQVSLGNASSVFARDSNNAVYNFNPSTGALTPNATTGVATHIAAAYDGSLWHAKPQDANMHRYLSGPNIVDAIPVKQGFVNSVTKVAATGYGSAHCLVQQSSGGAAATPSTNLYRYDSPYVFKTAGSYFNTGKFIAQALGRLYVSILDAAPPNPNLPPNSTNPFVLAIDPHTGVELARNSIELVTSVFTTPVFDPVRKLIYVGVAPNDRTALQESVSVSGVWAFDAETLAQVWEFGTETGVDVQPTLIGQYLYFSDRAGRVYKLDAAAKFANPNVTFPLAWVTQVPNNPLPANFDSWNKPLRAVSAFAFHDDRLYAMAWDVGLTCRAGNIITGEDIWSSDTASFVAIDDADGKVTVLSAGNLVANVMDTAGFIAENHYGFAPLRIVLPQPTTDDPNRTVPALVLNGGNNVRIYQLPTDNTSVGAFLDQRFDTPGTTDSLGFVWLAAVITTGFAYDDGVRVGAAAAPPSIWFGATGTPGASGGPLPGAVLYSLDMKLALANGTPQPTTEQTNTVVRTTPVLYKDSRGDVTVMFGLSDAGSKWGSNTTTNTPGLAGLYGFAPDTGNLADLETGNTQITALTEESNNGVIYAAGSRIIGAEYAQVFGVRVDELVQDERDFIIEAELMQDFDSSSPNSFKDPTNPKVGTIPPSYMRYKAHVTVVDNNKQARPNEPVKVWCDTPGTIVTINDKNYTVGPDDNQYALVQTNVDGVIVLSAGNNSKDGSGNITDAPDINAAEFRVWASFMDPYERIVVFLDQEWHGRMTNVTNDYSDNGKNPDPDKPNLSTVRNLKGEPLFDDDDKADDAPQKIVNAIQQMKQGTNIGQGEQAALAGALQTVHATNSAAAYVAYSDLPGMHYAPNNALAQRPASAVAPMGFVFSRDVKTGKSAFTTMTHTQARDAMDALTQGVPRWNPDDPAVVAALAANRPLGATAVQSNRKNGFEKLWDWIKQALAKIESVLISVTDTVLTTISMVLPDGAKQVFQWIAQGIEDVVNAIGMLINMFEKAVDDALAAIGFGQFFDEWFNTQDWLTAQINTLTGNMSKYLVNNVKPLLDGYIEGLESGVADAFKAFKSAFSGQSITSLQGGNTTPHTAFTVGTPAKSHAVVCMDTAHTLKTQLGKASVAQAKLAASSVVVPNRPAGDPITDFINGFLQSLTTDPVLSKSLNQVKSDVSNLFTPSGLQNLFTNLIDTLIDIIEVLVVGALAVCKAFLDGVFAVIADIITSIMSVLNAEIDIPVISDLYQFLFDQPLTLLNVGTLIAALVVNIVYRIIQGKYPSQDGALSGGISPAQALAAATAASPQAQLVLGICNGILQILYGIMSAINDAADDAWAPLQRLTAGVGLFMACLSAPWIGKDDPEDADQCIWGFETMAPALLCILATVAPADEEVLPWVLAFIGLVQLVTAIVLYAETDKPETKDKLGLTIGVCSAVPLMVNPATQAGPWGKLAVVVIDVLGNAIAGGCVIALAVISSESSMSPAPLRRLYFPFVPHVPRPAQAHPLALAGGTP